MRKNLIFEKIYPNNNELHIFRKQYAPKLHTKKCTMSQEERIRLVISGIALGDMIGQPYEGKIERSEIFSPNEVPLVESRNHITDDTVMSFAVLDATLHLCKEYHSEKQIIGTYKETLRKYAKRYPDAGYGWHFYQWAVLDQEDEAYKSFGDGSAMRSGVIGAIFDHVKDVITYAYYSALPTHSHPEGIKGAIVTAVAVWMAFHGATKADIIKYVSVYYPNGFRNSQEFYERSCMDPDITMEELESLEVLTASTVCQIAVPEAFANFHHSSNFESCMRNCLRYPADTDTVAAISGGIAAAYYKETNLAGHMIEEVLSKKLGDLSVGENCINVNAELKKIKNYLSGLSEEELDNVLFECGIENVDFPK